MRLTRTLAAIAVACALTSGLLLGPPTTASAIAPSSTPTDTLRVGERLTSGEALVAGSYSLSMQGNGDLTIYRNDLDIPTLIWQADTAGHPGSFAAMQRDGNFVVYDPSQRPLFTTNTAGRGGTQVTISSDGTVGLYNSRGGAIWQTDTSERDLLAGDSLAPGQSIKTKAFRLVMQHDGNLVLYRAKRVMWQSGTKRNPGASLALQQDGNLVIRSASDRPLWSSRTTGAKKAAKLQICDDGTLTLFSSTGRIRWSTTPLYSLSRGETLQPGQVLRRDQYQLAMQPDGNLVLADPSRVLWQSGTAGKRGGKLTFQGDGNLVLSRSGVPYWSSGTQRKATTLTLGRSGVLTALGPGNRKVWSAGKPSKIQGTSQSALVILAARRYVGTIYVFGSGSPYGPTDMAPGLDCSGLTTYATFQATGRYFPHQTTRQAATGLNPARGALRPGDFIYYRNGSGLHHVVIYLGGNSMINAPYTGALLRTGTVDWSQFAGGVRVWYPTR